MFASSNWWRGTDSNSAGPSLLASRAVARQGDDVIEDEQRNDARRGRVEECTSGVNPGEGRFKIVDVGALDELVLPSAASRFSAA
jgi:hypothetical protein